MADNETPAISDESKAMLEEHVKKGKSRKFFLITKGSQIVTLIVFKKGPYGPKIQAAKKAGFRGEVACGVVTGKGVQLTFQLPGTREVSDAMKAEGEVYEAEPCKTAKLRGFLKDTAGLKAQPEFTIVRSVRDAAIVSELDDREEDSLASSEGNAAAEEERKAKLVATLKRMTARIQEAIATEPGQAKDILARVGVIKEHLQTDRLNDAKQALLDFHGFLNELPKNTAPADTGASASPPPPPPTPPAPPPTGTTTASAKQSEWDWRLKEVTPKLKKVLGERLGDFGAIASLFKDARTARETDITRAVELLKQCGKLLDAALAFAAPESNQTSTNAPYSQWQKAVKSVGSQLTKLVGEMRQSPHPYLREVAAFGLDSVTSDPGGIFNQLPAALKELQSSSGEDRNEKRRQIMDSLRNYRQFVNGSKVLEVLDTNGIYGPLNIRDTLTRALDQLVLEVDSAQPS